MSRRQKNISTSHYDVSVIIPYWNARLTICRALSSIRTQYGVNCEIIIINDGSHNEATSALSPFRGKNHIRIFDTLHRGAAAARNLGVEYSRAENIAFLDADDEFTPQSLHHKLKAFDASPNIGLVFGRTRLRNTNKAPPNTVSAFHHSLTIENILGAFPVLSASNMLIRRAAFEEIGRFDEGLRRASDQEWTARVCSHNRWLAVGIDHVTTEKYVRSMSLWTDAGALRQATYEVIATLEAKGHDFTAMQRSQIAKKLNKRIADYRTQFGGGNDALNFLKPAATVTKQQQGEATPCFYP